MTVKDNEIVSACIHILHGSRKHRNYGRRFMSAYQLWFFLKFQENPICQAIEQAYGRALGLGGGAPIGPAQRIAQALSRSTEIETQYLDTRQLRFIEPINGNIYKASGRDCGLFRYVGI